MVNTGIKDSLKWGLSLSGGGARGIVHVGILQAFENHDFKPVCVSGTSMGAIVGSLYASGMKPREMMDLLSSKGFLQMFRFRASLSGLLEMKYLKEVMQEHLPETFEELNLPFFAAATNLTRYELRIFDSGKLYDAVVASASIPVLFAPVEINGEKYVDGGVIDNLPVEVCRSFCDRVVAVEVNRGRFAENLENMRGVATEVFHIVVDRSSQNGIEKADAVIRPELDPSFKLLDFSRNEELFEIGLLEGERWLKFTFG